MEIMEVLDSCQKMATYPTCVCQARDLQEQHFYNTNRVLSTSQKQLNLGFSDLY